MRKRRRLRSQAVTALFRPALCGYTLLTTNTRSRRAAIAFATTSSAPPSPYISAVSTSVIPRSKPSASAAASSSARFGCSPIFQVPRPSAGTRGPVREGDAGKLGEAGLVHGWKNTGATRPAPAVKPRHFGSARHPFIMSVVQRTPPMPLDPQSDATRRSRRVPARLPRHVRDARDRRGRPRRRHSRRATTTRRPAARSAPRSRGISNGRIPASACCIR